MKDVQEFGFLKLAVWNLVVCERDTLARLSVQDVHEEFLENCILPEALPGWDVGVDQGHVVLVGSL